MTSDVSYMIVLRGLRPAGVAGHPDVENGEECEVWSKYRRVLGVSGLGQRWSTGSPWKKFDTDTRLWGDVEVGSFMPGPRLHHTSCRHKKAPSQGTELGIYVLVETGGS